ncbi:hypothetical protein F1728_19780 [Gimesia benthica]|uniref:Uncharacterized protein n=1 Tax=Gimesia benthica TaxID=2608982 RepID=A0A6I6AEJ3_9PLAN|nr:hypothetical protein [Gimesia benthica]QGQ24787.1 hypothetical protein F1728_19780 [Gimesia benthica]
MKSKMLFLMAAFCVSGTCFASDPLNSQWNSQYLSAGGGQVNAFVILSKMPGDQFGNGVYKTQFGDGQLTQVRVSIGNRQNTPMPAPGSPMPGPNSPLSGVNNPSQTKFVKGLWQFQGSTGWFRWELYQDSNGTPRFTGKWGFLVNNQQGPVRGNWDGNFNAGGNQGGGNGPFNGAVIPIN